MSKSTKSSKQQHGRTVNSRLLGDVKDGPLDIIAAKDTSYPNLQYVRKGLKGNGARPGNPFGREIPEPRETNPSITERHKRK
jgi:hypothetical protein